MDKDSVDLTYLKEIAMGSKEFMLEMVDSFKSKTPEEIAQMRSYFESADFEAMGKKAHKLKSSFSFMGMANTAKYCKELQNMGLDAEKIEEMPSYINYIENAYDSALEDLKGEMENL